MVDRRARGGLTALVQPKSGDHRRKVRTPDALDEGRAIGGRHGAGGGSEHIGQTGQYGSRTTSCADRSNTAGMCVDQSRSHCDSLLEAEFTGGFARQPQSERRAAGDDLGTDAVKTLVGKSAKPHGAEIVAVQRSSCAR